MDRKDSYTGIFLKAADLEHNQTEVNRYKSIWWFNNRPKEIGGLRLTEQGITFVEDYADIKTYSIEFPRELTIGPQILIWLDKFIDCPWYLHKRTIKVLSEKTAFELYMFSGDIKKLGLAKTMNKHLNQESSTV
jgi:hypothetical protein